MDKWEGRGTIFIVIHSVWSFGGSVLLSQGMHVRKIDTYEYLAWILFWGGGV